MDGARSVSQTELTTFTTVTTISTLQLDLLP